VKSGNKNESQAFYFSKRENVQGSSSTRHYHELFEIYYLKSGRCNYFIHERSYDVCAGDIILIPKGVIHRTNYGARPHSCLLINFAEELISPEILGQALALGYHYRNAELAQHVEALFSRIEEDYNRADELTPHALRIYTEQLLVLMIRCGNKKRPESSGGSVVEHAMRYIHDNYSSDIRLSAVAKLMNVCPEHLSRLFKRQTAFGFNEYVTLSRLQRAENILMNEPGRSICEIAYACGFNDSNYFSYKFKEQYGVSPSKAREKFVISGAKNDS